MAAKKAAKKKAAKKAGKKGEHEQGRDLRRAYEHLGRLEALGGSVGSAAGSQINTLIAMARVNLRDGDEKSAAELLRASEHLAFGSLAGSTKDPGVGEALLLAVEREFNHLTERAVDRWDRQDVEPAGEVVGLYERTFDSAESAFARGAYRRALEFARAAEALTHVRTAQAKLEHGKNSKKLKG